MKLKLIKCFFFIRNRSKTFKEYYFNSLVFHQYFFIIIRISIIILKIYIINNIIFIKIEKYIFLCVNYIIFIIIKVYEVIKILIFII